MPTLPWFARGDLGKCARKRGGVWYWCYGVLKTRLLWSVAERAVCARGNRPTERWNEQSRQRRFQEYALLLVLRQEPARGAQAHRRPDRFYLRRVRRVVHGHHPRGEQILAGEVARRHPDAARDPQGARRLRHWPGLRQESALGGSPQPLQAAQSPEQAQRRRTGEVEY